MTEQVKRQHLQKEGIMRASFKSVKLEFDIPGMESLRFFCFRKDVEEMLAGRRVFVNIFYDQGSIKP